MRTTILVAASAVSVAAAAATTGNKVYKHVIAISADGLHSSDVGKYIAKRPKSTIAKLLQTGYEYTDAYTAAVRNESIFRRRLYLPLNSPPTPSQVLWPSTAELDLAPLVCGTMTLTTGQSTQWEATAQDLPVQKVCLQSNPESEVGLTCVHSSL